MELILCPRGKKGQGRRKTLTVTLDGEIYDRLQHLYQRGTNISHVVDSALWLYFDKCPLSFEIKEGENE